ncbi:hypothetical protein Q4Q35_10850 [Flavivirga aquimarina]|uniref:Phage integrase SAM-like domain-containing protein n=1 Tax=Flavivirga aquimarina TaxID=2027862 RepID=A0ABT8WAZ3_9FLAO|nr:hypothetical protein [Flavivirga aquimarina]MDO5970304.1 hypothetical protein [Flavivirga aquimarina]
MDTLEVEKIRETDKSTRNMADIYHDFIIKMYENDVVHKLTREDIHAIFENDIIKFKNKEALSSDSTSWLNKVKYLTKWYDFKKRTWKLD